jgi:hypothetical protein
MQKTVGKKKRRVGRTHRKINGKRILKRVARAKLKRARKLGKV